MPDDLIQFLSAEEAETIEVEKFASAGPPTQPLIPYHVGQPQVTESEKPFIKVIGVGGGGCNAVNHMYGMGIQHVSFVAANTDVKSLNQSPVPVHLLLGDGLGAGGRPETGRRKAEESLTEIKQLLNDGTKMVFITAGMGGGTGTGAAPVIARAAREMGILTVGIVTIPARQEGKSKAREAVNGLLDLQKEIDSLIIISNGMLIQHFPNERLKKALDYADDVLCNATRSIVDLVYRTGHIAVDFQDVTEVLQNGHYVLIATAEGDGFNRVSQAISNATNSPILDNFDIRDVKKILLNISYSELHNPLRMTEYNEVMEFMESFYDQLEWTKNGVNTAAHELGDRVMATILASGIAFEDNADRLLDKLYPATRNARKLYRFTVDTIDNEGIINLVSNTPTYLRRAETISQIRGLEQTVPSVQTI